MSSTYLGICLQLYLVYLPSTCYQYQFPSPSHQITSHSHGITSVKLSAFGLLPPFSTTNTHDCILEEQSPIFRDNLTNPNKYLHYTFCKFNTHRPSPIHNPQSKPRKKYKNGSSTTTSRRSPCGYVLVPTFSSFIYNFLKASVFCCTLTNFGVWQPRLSRSIWWANFALCDDLRWQLNNSTERRHVRWGYWSLYVETSSIDAILEQATRETEWMHRRNTDDVYRPTSDGQTFGRESKRVASLVGPPFHMLTESIIGYRPICQESRMCSTLRLQRQQKMRY